MNNREELISQAQALIQLGEKVLETETSPSHTKPVVNDIKFHEFRISCLSYLSRVFGEKLVHCENFKAEVTHPTGSRTRRGIGILKSAISELEGDWLATTRGEIIKDTLTGIIRQAKKQIDQENYKAAALIAGMVVDQVLRAICQKQGIKLYNEIKGKAESKKTLQLTGEAYKKKLYDRQTNKAIITWVELYNDVAAGKETPNLEKGVTKMLKELQSFLTKTNL